MSWRITCKKCGMSFVASEVGKDKKIQCPGCFSKFEKPDGPAPVQVGGYRLSTMLGQGGMGQVFRALSPDGKEVAIKVMSQDLVDSEELQERFKREMAIMASLTHENIVSLLDRGATEDLLFFVMELVEGETLRNLMRKGPLSEEAIVQISKEVLTGLGYAHSKGVIHRDIKPENILFDKRNRAKVTDFGLARKSTASSQDSLTGVNAFLGTESYMSPEQKVNPRCVTHKSDIYSYGVVLYEMLTGTLPMGLFQPPSVHKRMAEFWDNLIFRMLDINSEMRPQNCLEVISAIEAFDSGKLPEKKVDVRKQPEKKPNPPKPTEEDVVKRESERIEAGLKDFFQKAKELTDSGNYKEALAAWEGALITVSSNEERASINEWIVFCRLKISEAERKASIQENLATAISFLCPLCRKPFSRPISEPIPNLFPCPKCGGRLKYDSIRKRISPETESNAPSKTLPNPGDNPAGKKINVNYYHSPEILSGRQMTLFKAVWSNTLFIMGSLLLLDLWDPSILNNFIEWIDLVAFSSNMPFGAIYMEANIRMAWQVVVVFLACCSIYRGAMFHFS